MHHVSSFPSPEAGISNLHEAPGPGAAAEAAQTTQAATRADFTRGCLTFTSETAPRVFWGNVIRI